MKIYVNADKKILNPCYTIPDADKVHLTEVEVSFHDFKIDKNYILNEKNEVVEIPSEVVEQEICSMAAKLHRNLLLSETDFILSIDFLNDAELEIFKEWRQKLRDMSKNKTNYSKNVFDNIPKLDSKEVKDKILKLTKSNQNCITITLFLQSY